MINEQLETIFGADPPKEKMMESRHKIGDLVTITARVAGVQFVDNKVRYAFDIGPDLAIVDSDYVFPAAIPKPAVIVTTPEDRVHALDLALRTPCLSGSCEIMETAILYADYIQTGERK